ncbi:MAG TPA: [FeFe] hydrogenase H-cluster radical SAM maturase HydE [Candidatus Ornithomonoglobus intestinigallinarum]|uniref:[FeFe] hydrogenase H-cluster radical SAM maturase HydE n=1 Tax=Candidatus Ornithomonoglobus intestinigallinarum TaxID=2840894 RepID=A0A9D1KRC6_9FIRM|nr:[FeFe] hydrogenase H-cluster radical SAM maturase HydE [Candidatus Ornithomonoglobus intestinigallinarum]
MNTHFNDSGLELLFSTRRAPASVLGRLIDTEDTDALFSAAMIRRREYYGNKIYTRGLIEFTNHCKNNCLYCGIRAANKNTERYRLTKPDILECCRAGYEIGFRTFVLQGGEDTYFTDGILCDIVYDIKSSYPDCAVTLSVGERSRESYKKLFDAGADRYLLRHETASPGHYAKLHPSVMSLENRKRCLFELKDIGYQVGSGFMVGSPYQTLDNLVEDLLFLCELKPDMIGIGPFLPHKDTPFGDFKKGSIKRCLNLIAILRLMFPNALIPATTALGTIAPDGRERGFTAGANVVMPNLSPSSVRRLYTLYDNKLCTGTEAAEHYGELKAKAAGLGFEVVSDRGDAKALRTE